MTETVKVFNPNEREYTTVSVTIERLREMVKDDQFDEDELEEHIVISEQTGEEKPLMYFAPDLMTKEEKSKARKKISHIIRLSRLSLDDLKSEHVPHSSIEGYAQYTHKLLNQLTAEEE